MITFEWRPEVERPPLICAFRGWNDGGEAATSAVGYLRDRWQARRFAWIEAEEFFDFQVVRPMVRLDEGLTRRIDWPANEFLHARPGDRDVILFIGTEPNLRWKAFADGWISAAKDLGVETLVTLGAFLADVPHTHTPPVAGSASDPDLASRLELTSSRYEGPTGIVGVLHDAASRVGLQSVSLWAAVPHYLPRGPNPNGALALLRRLAIVLDLHIETDTLERAAKSWQESVDALLAENPELLAFVHRLEEAMGERDALGPIPSGDEFAAELERFLREQRGETDR